MFARTSFTEEEMTSYIDNVIKADEQAYKYASQHIDDEFAQDVRKALTAVLKKYPDSEIAADCVTIISRRTGVYI